MQFEFYKIKLRYLTSRFGPCFMTGKTKKNDTLCGLRPFVVITVGDTNQIKS